jgi:hypothetical protein
MLLDLIGEKYTLKEQGSQGFDDITVSGMKFDINSYKAEGLGYVSTMVASGFLGLMKMETVIVNPTEVDLPLYSYDRIHAFGKEKIMAELYDTMVEKRSLPKLLDVKENHSKYVSELLGSDKVNWYDHVRLPETVTFSGHKSNAKEFDEIAKEYTKAFLNTPAEKVEEEDIETKNKKIDYYVDGLLNNGGPATDLFVKKIGKEKTTELFKKVLFVR